MRREAGFTLVEAVCVLAIVALLASLALPARPFQTSRPRLEAYAIETASILIADRDAAIRRRVGVSTALDYAARVIRSGAYPRNVRFPHDVAFDALLAKNCAGRDVGNTIDFFPNGMSCGGTVALRRGDASYQIRVNWLTGGVEVIARDEGGK
jgi:general secretion pathway protein H